VKLEIKHIFAETTTTDGKRVLLAGRPNGATGDVEEIIIEEIRHENFLIE